MFEREDFERLTDEVVAAWLAGSDRDWSAAAGTLDWTCRQTAGHAVDCTFAPAFFAHAHDVCKGLGVTFEPSSHLCSDLIGATAASPWSLPGWRKPTPSDDPWGELLAASGRLR